MQRSRFVLREAADIERVLDHLTTHWKLPGIDVQVQALPALESQYAQDRFVRISTACNCVLGNALGALTLVVGCLVVWASTAGWPAMGIVLVATLGAVLTGKAIELAWTRLKLMRVLWNLRDRLADVAAGRVVRSSVRVVDASSGAGADARARSAPLRNRSVPIPAPRTSIRPVVPVRDIGDIDALVPGLLTRWTLPRIELEPEGLPALTLQRTQDQLVRLSAGLSYLPAGVLAMATFMGGFLYLVWPSAEVLEWKMGQGWADILLVVGATSSAALTGLAGEAIWIRARLVRVLLVLRRRLQEIQPIPQ